MRKIKKRVKKDEKPFIFSTNWKIYRLSHSLTRVRPLTKEELPPKHSKTKLWMAFGFSMLSIVTLFIMPELTDVPKLMTYTGNKLMDILELITRTLSSI